MVGDGIPFVCLSVCLSVCLCVCVAISGISGCLAALDQATGKRQYQTQEDEKRDEMVGDGIPSVFLSVCLCV